MNELPFSVRPVSRAVWPDLITLFETVAPASRCWCMYWQIGPEYRRRTPEANRDDLGDAVEADTPTGLLA